MCHVHIRCFAITLPCKTAITAACAVPPRGRGLALAGCGPLSFYGYAGRALLPGPRADAAGHVAYSATLVVGSRICRVLLHLSCAAVHVARCCACVGYCRMCRKPPCLSCVLRMSCAAAHVYRALLLHTCAHRALLHTCAYRVPAVQDDAVLHIPYTAACVCCCVRLLRMTAPAAVAGQARC